MKHLKTFEDKGLESDEKTYVTIIKYGRYEDKETLIVYAGNDLNVATETIIEQSRIYNRKYNSYGYIQTWRNGEMIAEKEFDL